MDVGRRQCAWMTVVSSFSAYFLNLPYFWAEIFHIWNLIFHKISEFLRLPSEKNRTKNSNIKNRKYWVLGSNGAIKESVFAFLRDFEGEAASRTPWHLLLILHIFTMSLYGDFSLSNLKFGDLSIANYRLLELLHTILYWYSSSRDFECDFGRIWKIISKYGKLNVKIWRIVNNSFRISSAPWAQ